MANDINNSETQYRYLLETSLNKVTEEIALLELQKDTFLGIIKQNEKRIEKLRVEQTRLKQELENRNSKEITKTGGKAEEVMDTETEMEYIDVVIDNSMLEDDYSLYVYLTDEGDE